MITLHQKDKTLELKMEVSPDALSWLKELFEIKDGKIEKASFGNEEVLFLGQLYERNFRKPFFVPSEREETTIEEIMIKFPSPEAYVKEIFSANNMVYNLENVQVFFPNVKSLDELKSWRGKFEFRKLVDLKNFPR